MVRSCLFIFFLFCFKFPFAYELYMADSHGPISVMGDHIHKKDEFMFSYRFSKMKMNEMFNGTKSLTLDEIMSTPNSASNGLGTYMNAPTKMQMDMHMFGAMYAPSNSLTLMVMTNYSRKEMTQQRNIMGGKKKFRVRSSGLGDMSVSGLYKLYNSANFKSHSGFGVSFPTGSINKRDATPASSNGRLGYAMQNGSGTYDQFIFLNSLKKYRKTKLGSQIYYKISAFGKNSKGYKHGNTFIAKVWTSFRLIDFFSTSLNINYTKKSKMKGTDNEMNPRMSPVMDSRNQGYQKLNLGLGFNFINHSDAFKNHRIGLEIFMPIYQRYRGIQMSEQFRTMIGWQYGF